MWEGRVGRTQGAGLVEGGCERLQSLWPSRGGDWRWGEAAGTGFWSEWEGMSFDPPAALDSGYL